MGLFKSEHEREAERAERERVEAARAAQRAESDRVAAEQEAAAAHASSPLGRAEAAHTAGNAFFEIQLDVGTTQGQASFGLGSTEETRTDAHLGVLGQIEQVGWRLENVGYVFVQTGQESTDKFIATGQYVAISGKTVGVYLFRRA